MDLHKEFYSIEEVADIFKQVGIIKRKGSTGYHFVHKLVHSKDPEKKLDSYMPGGKRLGRKVSKEVLQTYIENHAPKLIREKSNEVEELKREIADLKRQLNDQSTSTNLDNINPNISYEEVISSLPQNYRDAIESRIYDELEKRDKIHERVTEHFTKKVSKLEKKLYGKTPFELDENNLYAEILGNVEVYHSLMQSFQSNSDFTCHLIENGYPQDLPSYYDVRITKTSKRKKEIKPEFTREDFLNITLGDLSDVSVNNVCIPFKLNSCKHIDFSFKDMGKEYRFSFEFDTNKYYMTTDSMDKIHKELDKKTIEKAVLKSILKDLKKYSKHKEVFEYLTLEWKMF